MPKYLDYHGLETLKGDLENIYVKKAQKGVANGVASLNANGKIPTSQIPDEVGVEIDDNAGTGVTNKTWSANKLTAQLAGKASLDGNGKVPTEQLPSYVDDVLEFASVSAFPVTGETGKIYVALDTNLTYRWSGSTYIEISAPASIIDDSTGSGISDKTWSANKLTSELNLKAPKANPVFTGNISLGRSGTSGANSIAVGSMVVASGVFGSAFGDRVKATGDYSSARGTNNTEARGMGSSAEGSNTLASGLYSHSEGDSTVAEGRVGHSEGYATRASGDYSHAEGNASRATGNNAHAEGYTTYATGDYSHSQGYKTTASGAYSHVAGKFNIDDYYDAVRWPEWASGTQYYVGDRVKRTVETEPEPGTIVVTITGYVCKTPNHDATFNASKWIDQNGIKNYAEIIGNGKDANNKSNARALDWNGNEYLKGDLYVGCGADSTGGRRVVSLESSGKINADKIPATTYKFLVSTSENTSSSSVNYSFNFTRVSGPEFTNNVRVIGFNTTIERYLKNLSVTINDYSISGSYDLRPNAPSGSFEMYIAETA